MICGLFPSCLLSVSVASVYRQPSRSLWLRLLLFLFPSCALSRSRPVFFCLPLFPESLSLPRVGSPRLSHPPSASFSPSSSRVLCVSLATSLSPGSPSPSRSRSLAVSLGPARSLHALPLAPPPLPPPPAPLLPPSARLPSPYLAGREGWREEAACGRGAGGGGREQGRAEEGGGWC